MRIQNLLFSFFIVFFSSKAQEQSYPFFEDRIVLEADDRVAAYAIPNIIATEKGTILCFATARIGDNHDWGNVMEVVVIRSTDNGATWTKPEVIASVPDWTIQEISALYVAKTNKIIVFGHKSPRFNADGERITETWMIGHPDESKALGASYFIVESTDDGKTWSEMQDIDLPYWPHDPGISLKYGEYKGRLIVPARITKGKEFDWNNMYNAVLISDDDGDTWRAGGLTQSHVGEACVAELSDGRIYMNSRNHATNYGVRVHAVSSDGGETFSEFGDDPGLIEPTCDAGMTQFEHPAHGNVILFSNPAVKATKQWDSASRKRMTVKASFDDCKTWPNERLIFAGPAAYSGLAAGKNGMILLVYERASAGNRDSRENLSIARFNLEWLMQQDTEQPVIEPDSDVFFGTQDVEIKNPGSQPILYTLDGSEPQSTSNLYEKPIRLEKTATLKAACFSGDGNRSITSEAVFTRSPYPPLVYQTKYDKKYPASGAFALVDGIRGTLNFNDGRWQGFEARDAEVTMDLVQSQKISEISAGFLQSTDFWIFYPREVQFSISKDNKNFTVIGTIRDENPAVKNDLSIRNFAARFNETEAQFVRIIARNIKTCPAWHKGAGGSAWIFFDEIQIN